MLKICYFLDHMTYFHERVIRHDKKILYFEKYR